MATNKAKFKIGASVSADRGYEAISAQVLTITLEDATDVISVRYELYDANDGTSPLASLNAPDLTFDGGMRSKIISPADGSTTITMITNGADTHSWLCRATATTDTGDHVYERIIALKNGKPRKTVPAEDTQWTARGWSDAWNELVDYVTGVIGGGGYNTIQYEGVAQTQRNIMNFTGAGVVVTDVGGVTTITISGGGAVSGSAVGQTQIWNGSAWTAGALDLADADARTGVLPVANGGTGLSSAGGVANRALVTTDGTNWAAGLVSLATMVAGQLPFANVADGSATSVLGRSAATTGAMASIAASLDGQVLRRAGGLLGFGAVDLADTNAVTGQLPFANVADGSATSLFGRASGTAGVQASIAAGVDGQVMRRAAGALAFGAVDLADADAITGLLPHANIADGSAASVFGRSAATTGVMASIAATADGQVLRRSGTTIGFGALNLAGGVNAVTGLLPFANIADGLALSVFGRSTNTSGVMGAIAGTDGQVLRVSGTTLGFGQLVAANIADGSITLGKLANGTAASVVGRSAATGGVYADIASSADGQVLRRSAGVVGWGAVDLADTDAVMGLLPFANIASGSATSILGRAAGTAGELASIAATADGQYLQRVAGALTWATLGIATVAGGTAIGQVYINTAGNVPGWGAVDLADADAVTGLLPHANFASISGLSVFGRSANTSGVGASITGTDGQVLRVSGTTLGFGTIAATGIADGSIPLGKLANGTAASVVGRSAATGGAYADIASSADGQVLRRAAGVVGWGAVDLADTDGVTGILALANMPSLSGLSVLGRSGTTSGVMAGITGTTGQVLRVDATGTTLGFGAISTTAYSDASITLAKLANGTASSVLGRSASTGGVYADIASSADGQVLRRGASGVIAWGAVDLADADAITGLLPHANIATGTALSVFGRAVNSTGVMGSLVASADGQVMRRSGTTIGFGTLATAAYGDGTVTGAKIENVAGPAVFGRAVTAVGPMAAITGTDGQVLRVSGTTLGFGTIAGAGITDGSITLPKLANGTAASVIGRAANSVGAYADIASSADGQVLRRAAGVVGWGAVDLADGDAVTGLLPHANMASLAGLSVFGRSANTSGVMAAITGTDGQVLRVSGTTLGFGTLALSGLTGGSAVGQVLRNTAGNVPAWGALDLADADAVTGLLPGTNVNPNFGSANIVSTGSLTITAGITNAGAYAGGPSPSPTGKIRLSNGDGSGDGIQFADSTGLVAIRGLSVSGGNTLVLGDSGASAYTIDSGGTHQARIGGTPRMTLSATVFEIATTTFRFDSSVAATVGITHEANSAALAAGQTLLLEAQGVTHAGGGTTGGTTLIRGGVSVSGVGGPLDLRSGEGATANGNVTMRVGGTTFLFADGSLAYPTVGMLRAPHNGPVIAGRSSGGVNRNLLRWGTTTDELILGDTTHTSRVLGNTVHLGNVADTYVSIDSSSGIVLGVDGAQRLSLIPTELETSASVVRWQFASAVAAPVITIDALSTVGVSGTWLSVLGQDVTAATGTNVGGEVVVGGGNATSGFGGPLTLYSGDGSVESGDVTVRLGGESGAVVMQAADLGGRTVLGLFGTVTTTEMPTGTGSKVLFWKDANTGENPTTGMPNGGGILSGDATLGLSWKGKRGVETTIAPHGDSGNTTKRRFIDWKSQPTLTVDSSGATFTAAQFDISNFNGSGFSNGVLQVKARIIHRSPPSYASVIERTEIVQVTAGVLNTGTLFPHTAESGDGGALVVSIDHSGSVVRLRITQGAAGPPTTTIWAFFEVTGFET